MATNLRLRDVHEGDLLDLDGRRGTVSCAMVLDDDVIVVVDDERGGQVTFSGAGQAVRLIARQLHNSLAGAASSITNPA